MNEGGLGHHPCLILSPIFFFRQTEERDSGFSFGHSLLIMIDSELLLIINSLAVPGIEDVVAHKRDVASVLWLLV